MAGPARRAVLRLLAAAPAMVAGGVAYAQPGQPPRIGRYRVWMSGSWMRNLVIEDASSYAVYDLPDGRLYGRGTYAYDGEYARFSSGPFHTLGWWGRSFVRPDGKHSIRLSRFVEAISEN